MPRAPRSWLQGGDGTVHHLDALYPALGCAIRSESDLAVGLGATCTKIGNLLVDGRVS